MMFDGARLCSPVRTISRLPVQDSAPYSLATPDCKRVFRQGRSKMRFEAIPEGRRGAHRGARA